MSVDNDDTKLDLSEKGRKKDGTPISLDRRLFMQFQAYGDCWNTKELIKELENTRMDLVLLGWMSQHVRRSGLPSG